MTIENELTKTCKQQQAHPVLVVEDPKGKRIINLEKNIYSIGRESKNSIVIHSKLVSRHHATLLRVKNPESNYEFFKIIDGDLQGNNSTNGLKINGKEYKSHTLQHKDTIELGREAKASYLVFNSDLSEREILEYCEIEKVMEGQTVENDPFDTLVMRGSEVEVLNEVALLRLASFPELLPSPIVEIDIMGKITYLNPAAILKFTDIQEAALKHPILAGLLEAVRNGKKELFVREVEVEEAIFEQSVHYIAESHLIRSYLVDISDRKRAEAEREELLVREQAARLEAERANRMKDEFLATLSHELRTPLNAMLGWAQMLRTRKFDAATTGRALETIERNSKSLAQLIEDVLDVSRIITGKLHLNIHPIELAPAISAAIDTMRPAAEAKEIQISSILDRDMGPINGDVNRLQQIIWNLLSNAVKFTPKGGSISVRLSALDSHAQIQVKDTGMGIDADFLPYVFERFRQADSSTTRKHGGLGLGLAIVRHLVELQGGVVRAESLGVGQGATFTVTFPRPERGEGERGRGEDVGAGLADSLETKQITLVQNPPGSDVGAGLADSVETKQITLVQNPPGSDVGARLADSLETKQITLVQNPPSLGESGTISSSHTLEGLRVLVVDDEVDARNLLIAMLEQYGAQVSAVATAGDALSTLALEKPNILVSDIGMPNQDGYALITEVRSLDASQGGTIPAVALTAYARASDRDRAISAGFQFHIPKPVNPAELVAVIANLSGRLGKL